MPTHAKLFLVASISLAMVLPQLGTGPEPAGAAPARPAQNHTVRLVVDYPDGTQVHYTRLPFAKDMNVLDAMNAAKSLEGPRALTFSTKGSGDMAMIISIGGVENEGGGKNRRNWQYWVNDEFAKQGAGARSLQPGDRVTWSLCAWSEPPAPRPQ